MKTSVKKTLQISGLVVFFLLIIAYAFLGSRNLIFGVKIKNVSIEDGKKVENAILEVTGNANNATKLTLNGREISISEEGDFHETIALLLGYNIINIRAEDKFGYSDEKNFRLVGGSAEEAELQVTY